jgi:hypothetical protein
LEVDPDQVVHDSNKIRGRTDRADTVVVDRRNNHHVDLAVGDSQGIERRAVVAETANSPVLVEAAAAVLEAAGSRWLCSVRHSEDRKNTHEMAGLADVAIEHGHAAVVVGYNH